MRRVSEGYRGYREYRKVAALKTYSDFTGYLAELESGLPVDETLLPPGKSPLAGPYDFESGRRIGNRFCILPMEGWDGTPEGRPTELTARRWENFGRSGAKLIWGGEAAAVVPEGRANPRQLMLDDSTAGDIRSLKDRLVHTHEEAFGTSADLMVGLQLTHSGRFSRPADNKRLEPKIAYHHPILDRLFDIGPELPVLTDGELEGIIAAYVKAARLAGEIGFDFVDIKHCHGYLGHELLSARTRNGRYGGGFENRTRFLREIIEGIRLEAPALDIGVRLSVFDFPPFRPDEPGGTGRPLHTGEDGPYRFGFGCNQEDPLTVDLREVEELLRLLEKLGVRMICTTAGSPYYNPHIQRPALYPPSDGYVPPEDPLVGTARQIRVTGRVKEMFPGMFFVGSAYTYLQEWLPKVAQAVIRGGLADSIGLGRMVLSYPELPADVLAGRPLDRKRICRTFSECTTAPRKGLVSGCYPLDDFYRSMPERPMI